MVHYKLNYFAGRGAGEVIRQIFVVAGQDYEDNRITMDEWPQHKDKMPFKQMPVLEVDGRQLPQSFAIARYLARQFGLAGKCPWEEAVADSLADQHKDFMTEIRPYLGALFGFAPGDLEKLTAEVYLPAAKKNFPLYVKALKQAGSGYMVGSSLTWVDLLIAEYVAVVIDKVPQALEDFPELKEHAAKIHSIDSIAKWRAARPESAF